MNSELWLVLIASTIFFAAITYAFWTKLRILRFQADLLSNIADLRERAASLQGLNDPAYIATHQRLCGMEAVAECLTIGNVNFLQKHGCSDTPLPKSENAQLQQELDLSLNKALSRGTRFLFRESRDR
jgi:hypothetical protein